MRRILIIDDDEAVRGAMATLLEFKGFEVISVPEGNAGLKAVQAGHFDLAIVDILMPGMDGLQTIKAFREHNPALPIVVVSGAMNLFDFRDSSEAPPPDVLAMATSLGAVTAVPKPYKPRELLAAVENSLLRAA